jgi:hypothetical protein
MADHGDFVVTWLIVLGPDRPTEFWRGLKGCEEVLVNASSADVLYRALGRDIERCLCKGGYVGKRMALPLQIEEVSVGREK